MACMVLLHVMTGHSCRIGYGLELEGLDVWEARYSSSLSSVPKGSAAADYFMQDETFGGKPISNDACHQVKILLEFAYN